MVMQPAGMVVMNPGVAVMQPVVQPVVVQQQVQQQQQMAVNVPIGIEPGQAFMVQAPTGQQLQVTCPPNTAPGAQIVIGY